MSATTQETVGVLDLDGQWHIALMRFGLDEYDNFRVMYPTYIDMGEFDLKMYKPSKSGRMLYKEVEND